LGALQKVFIILSSPLNLFFLLIFATAVLGLVKQSALSKKAIKIAFTLLFVTSQPYFADVILFPLEHKADNKEDYITSEHIDLIFTPACFYSTKGDISEISRWSECSLQRLTRSAQLSIELDRPIIVTGGYFLHDKTVSYAQQASAFLTSLGVKNENIISIPTGTNTKEEIKAVENLVNQKNIILVTSATHSERCMLLLSESRANVFHARVDYLSSGSLTPFLAIPSIDALKRTERALYEYGARIKHELTT